MDEQRFADAVEGALAGIPAQLRELIDNLDLAVEDEDPHDPSLLGLYVGTPLTERTGDGYAGSLPDRVFIYRRPLVQAFGHDAGLLEHEIRVTVLHEVAHHFGIGEDRLRELGWD